MNKINDLDLGFKYANDKISKKDFKNLIKQFKEFKENNTKINGQLIKEIITINGVRFVLEDNSWGLIRASSNKPSLVVVVETLKSNKDTKNIFDFIDKTLQKTGINIDSILRRSA